MITFSQLLTELSKSTTASYIKGASKDVAGQIAVTAVDRRPNDDKLQLDRSRKIKNRFKYIDKAADKLSDK